MLQLSHVYQESTLTWFDKCTCKRTIDRYSNGFICVCTLWDGQLTTINGYGFDETILFAIPILSYAMTVLNIFQALIIIQVFRKVCVKSLSLWVKSTFHNIPHKIN